MKIFGLFVFFIISCGLFMKCEPMPEMTYRYVDGSNNQYIIAPDSLKYRPIKPEFSSSGVYSGGEPKSVAISDEQFKSITIAIETAFDNKEDHIKKRLMGSGTIRAFEDGDLLYQFMLSMNAGPKKEIEAVLKAALANEE